TLEASASSLEDFLRELDMQAVVNQFDEANLPRVVQLFHRTNQYNLTTRRYSEADVRSMMSTPGVHTRSLRLRDRLGDRGLVAVVIAREAGQALEIDSWLMSCRVLNRTVEHRLLCALVEVARERNLTRLVGGYLPTPKNSPARDHYSKLGFDLVEALPDGSSRWEWPISRELPTSFVMPDKGEAR
ncbi:MAG: FkbH like protein, partial [Deltaproteobacteria bacterium]|nr:FkbH like protein [Deltaproteobacteria bacterium]